MKKSVILLLVCAILFAVVPGIWAKGGKEKSNVFVIATDTTFAPFEFQDAQGQYVGVDIELLAAIAADQGFAYDLQPLGFSAAVAALESSHGGRCYCRYEHHR